jgi:CRP-like cAMP-binding protein
MNQPAQQFRNRILASLPEPEMDHIVPHLTFVSLPQHKNLLDEELSCGYFLESGVASIVVTLCNGDSVEVGVAGTEALIGLSLLLGAQAPLGHTFMQIAGSGFRIKAAHLREVFEHCPELRQHLLRYMQAFLTQIAQTAACNRMHTIDERLARWLLACRDRVDSDQLRLTHEFLAQMLGAPRTTVTQAAGILQRSGLIACERGAVTIADRLRLEKAACECYCTVRDTYRQLGLL